MTDPQEAPAGGRAVPERARPRLYRRGPGSPYRALQSLRFLVTRDRAACLAFLLDRSFVLSRAARLRLLVRFTRITNAVRGYHTLGEMLEVSAAVLRRAGRERLTVVEVGCGKGASTAKLSLAVARAGGCLRVYDSFKGIPRNDERHLSLEGRPLEFREGAFRATLPSVERVLQAWGEPSVCTLVKGDVATTLAGLEGPVDVALLDVDLERSTRQSLRALVPRLRPDGVLYSLDGQLRATHQMLADPSFWRNEVGVEPPRVEGLWRAKLLKVSLAAPGQARSAPAEGGSST